MIHRNQMCLLWGIQLRRHLFPARHQRWAIGAVAFGFIAVATSGVRLPIAVAQMTLAQSPSIARNESESQFLWVNPTTGDDTTGNGKPGSPLKTIARALQVAQPNTVILLSPGLYSAESGETFPLILKPGVTLQGNPRTRGQDITIQGGGAFDSPTAQSQTLTIVAANQATLTGVTVTNPHPQGYGLWIESSSPVIVDNTFTGNRNAGIAVRGNSAPTIRSNYFYDNGGGGIKVDGTLQADVRENVFEGTENAALQLISDRQPLLSTTESSINTSNETETQPSPPRPIPSSLNSGDSFTDELNSQASLPSATIDPLETSLQPVPPDRTDNSLSASVVEPTPTKEADRLLESALPLLETAPISDSDHFTPSDNRASPSTQSEVVDSPAENSISAASFPVPSSLQPQPSTPVTSNPTESQPTPHLLVNESKPIENSPQTSPTEPPSRTGTIEISVPLPESTATPLVSQPTSEVPVKTPSSPPQREADSVPVLSSNNPSPSRGESQTATAPGQRYRVLVEATNDSQQNLVRSLIPEAFRTSFNGQPMMQVGLFSNRESAEEIRQMLDSKGLNTLIESLN